MVSGEENSAVYTWELIPAEGSSSDLSLITGDSARVIWDGPLGIYTLQVSVLDGNGCVSETISQQVQIVSPGALVFSAEFPDVVTCSDLAGGLEGSVPEHTKSMFRVIYTGASNLKSATVTIRNPEGNYIDLDGNELPDQQNPEVLINNPEADKAVDFEVSDNWENLLAGNVQFEIEIIKATLVDDTDVVAVEGTDMERTITVLPKPIVEFN